LAGPRTGLSGLFGLSRSFGWLIGKSQKPENQINKTNQIDRTDHPPSLKKNEQAWENGMGSLVKGVTCTVEQ
jgi:hypothetical protein